MVKQWLEQNPKWLLVFDNAKDSVGVRNYIPQGGIGHVLITSRNPGWRGTTTPLDVKVLERSESVDFLLKRTGYTDKEAADALAEALGDLPLALEQAGAYMDATRRSLPDYLKMFTARKNELWDRAGPPLDYPDTVATTWNIAFDEVKQISSSGADLLNLCAFLAPDDIPVELLNSGVEYLPESLTAVASDPLAFDDAVDPLRRYSLVEITAETISVHRLVQAVTRDRLNGDELKKWAEAAVRIVNKVFPFKSDDVETWPVCSRLLPHALAAAEHAESLDVASDSTARLLNLTGLYLKERAQFTEAKKMQERALAIGESTYGPNHPNVAAGVNNLGLVLQDIGDMEGAKKMYERALAIGEATYGPDHPQVAVYVNNLGDVLQDIGNMEGAKKMFERALAIDEAAYGPDHPNVAIRVNNLGLVLKYLGDKEAAKKMFKRALAIGEATYGPDHPRVAIYINNLGLVLNAPGDMEAAKKMFERALAIDEATYGPDHPTVAISVNNLGDVLKALGNMEGAKKMYGRALSIFTEYLGEDHPNTVTVQNNLDSLS